MFAVAQNLYSERVLQLADVMLCCVLASFVATVSVLSRCLNLIYCAVAVTSAVLPDSNGLKMCFKPDMKEERMSGIYLLIPSKISQCDFVAMLQAFTDAFACSFFPLKFRFRCQQEHKYSVSWCPYDGEIFPSSCFELNYAIFINRETKNNDPNKKRTFAEIV